MYLSKLKECKSFYELLEDTKSNDILNEHMNTYTKLRKNNCL